jgi:choline dehydrogenase-like flavoprotein/pimeloyl-ACP methyl ester carboxylesterase
MMDNDGSEAASRADNTAVRWLSEGLEELISQYDELAGAGEPVFDVVIVGSGYGGALAAAELADGIDVATNVASRICVLERGREYLAGMFPTSEADLPGSLTLNAPNSPDPYAATDGVLDLRLGEDVTVMLASGLGGGSLINAGVMEMPEKWVFDQPCWPKSLRNRDALDASYEAVRKRLAPNKVGVFDEPVRVKKRDALFRLAPKDAVPVSSYIASKATVNSADIPLKACTRCGDCMTGCNHRAKNSLDQNLLVAARRKKVRIVCGATVVSLSRADEGNPARGWVLDIVHTDPLLRRRQQRHFTLKTRRVILAAGTLGSTEILLRSRSEKLKFSSQLGQRFSTNGDFIAVSYDERDEVNAVASESQEFSEREVGPTITGMLKTGEGEDQLTVQELAIPGPIRRLFEEGFTTAHLFHRLGTGDPEFVHRPRNGGADPYAVQKGKIARTQALGVMGHDGAKGQLELRRRRNKDERHDTGWLPLYDTSIAVCWPELRQRPGLFDKQIDTLRRLIEKSGTGGVLLANPFFQLLPQELTRVLDMPRGPALTTHPLGGCPMADTWRDGVVDEHGQVFDADTPTSTHPGLVVLDGSIIPTSLGINPAFTISAVALRALAKLRGDWQIGPANEKPCDPGPMPDYKEAKPALDVPTEISIRERLEGGLHLVSDSGPESEFTVELTIRFKAASARQLASSMGSKLEVMPEESTIRIFRTRELKGLRDRGDSEFRCDSRTAFRARLEGGMRLLDRETSTRPCRMLRGLYAWYHNRGKRDAWNALANLVGGSRKKSGSSFVSGIWSVASHAGEVRLFEYDLVVGDELPEQEIESRLSQRAHDASDRGKMSIAPGTHIRGKKTFTYARASNPWNQMLEMRLTEFPGLATRVPTILKVEPKYFAREKKHLFEIVKQRDGATGLFELLSFLLHTLRLVAAVHVWSFRKPDAPSPEEPSRLPGNLPDLRPPMITDLRLKSEDELTGKPCEVIVRLTRYRNDGATDPVLLIHGFSASGTTFAHEALDPGLAKFLCEEGRDVWVVDLRTSSGLESSRKPWSFEQVGREDIPEVFKHILRETGAKQLDVVAHCMGAAMLSMSLLRELKAGDFDIVPHVRSVVLSQVGPMVSFTAANVFRAYAVSYIQQIFRESNFDFRPKAGIGSAFLDRMLATVPYPRKEFEFENPGRPCARTPYTATRHRMDAWFGRVFNVANMGERVLERIDDFFGAINMRTSFQTIHFARNSMVTTRRGRNAFIIPDLLERLKSIHFFSIHGAENGLSDPATLVRMERMTSEIGIPFKKWLIEGYGHQDCLMGRNARAEIFPKILDFLQDPQKFEAPKDSGEPVAKPPAPAANPAEASNPSMHVVVSSSLSAVPEFKFTARTAFMGPLIGFPDPSHRVNIAFAADPRYLPPRMMVTLPAEVVDESWRQDILAKIRAGKTPWKEHPLPKKNPDDTAVWYPVVESLPAQGAPAAAVLVVVYDMPDIIPKDPWLDFKSNADHVKWGQYAQDDDSSNELLEKVGDMLESGKFGITNPHQQRVRDGMSVALEALLCTAPLDELRQAQVILPSRRPEKASTLCFAVASCQYPAGPLDPALASASYKRLGESLQAGGRAPRFLVLVGDQIYADATAGVFDPSQLDDRYELSYEAWLQAPSIRDVLRRLPMLAGLDDHEIDNNWEPSLLPEGRSEKRRVMGLKAYFRVQRAAGPPLPPPNFNGVVPAWFSTNLDGFDFFFVDARSEREKRTIANHLSAQMVCEEQISALEGWLDRTNSDLPRFVNSGSILLPRRKLTAFGKAGAVNSDAWDGYPATFKRLLAYIANRRLRNLVFLSGDEHHSCIATARLLALPEKGREGEELTTVQSIHSSALNAPFTFANGEAADLAGSDWFSFRNPEQSQAFPWPKIGVEVRTQFVGLRGDGFAMLDCRRARSEAKWEIECSFSRPDGTESHTIVT